MTAAGTVFGVAADENMAGVLVAGVALNCRCYGRLRRATGISKSGEALARRWLSRSPATAVKGGRALVLVTATAGDGASGWSREMWGRE